MNFRMLIFLMGTLITGCTSPPSIPTISPTSTIPSLPTPTPAEEPTVFVSPIPVSLSPGQDIIFEDSGDKKFTGMSYGTGKTAIVLANMSIGSAAQWNPFVAAVDKDKFTTITFNFRNLEAADQDIAVILDHLREQGFSRVICIGASMGTRVCSIIGREPEIVGLVLIAGAVQHAVIAEATYPKLFIAGALDVWAYDIQVGFEKATEPKTLVLFENNGSHGTDLFRSVDHDRFLSLMVGFVNGLVNP